MTKRHILTITQLSEDLGRAIEAFEVRRSVVLTIKLIWCLRGFA
jgi:hypothetical protein